MRKGLTVVATIAAIYLPLASNTAPPKTSEGEQSAHQRHVEPQRLDAAICKLVDSGALIVAPSRFET
jgi:hypothetical protein